MSDHVAEHVGTHATPVEADVPISAVIAAEWLKFRSVRSTWLILVVGFLASVGMSCFVAWAGAWSMSEWTPEDRAEWDPVTVTLVGQFLAIPVAIIIATNVVTSEMASGMIRQTYLVTPQRSRVVIGKLVIACAVGGAFIALTTITMVVSGQMIFRFYDAPRVAITDGWTLRLLLAFTLTAPVMPWFCCCIAFIVRNTAVSIMSGLAFVFGPAIIGFFLPAAWQRNVISFLPGPANDAIAMRDLEWGSDYSLALIPAIVVTIFWLVVALVITIADVNRRDA